uniref:Cystatin domain-containing protein n=1 Tax=Mola mola TaxID=94237 RepID=A0A3Q3WW58_MOLML
INMLWKAVLPVLAAVLAVGLGGIVGGFQDIDVNDRGARNMLNFAVVQHNLRSNDAFLSQVAEVVSVRKQVVAGIKYIITARMGKSECRKNNVDQECPISQDPVKARVRTSLRGDTLSSLEIKRIKNKCL